MSGIVINSISISALWADLCTIKYIVKFVVGSVKNKSYLCCKISIVLIYIRQLDFQSSEMRFYMFIQVRK